MRRLSWALAAAVAILAVQAGTARNVGSSETSITLDVMQMQMQADKTMPITVVADPV